MSSLVAEMVASVDGIDDGDFAARWDAGRLRRRVVFDGTLSRGVFPQATFVRGLHL